ncbi:MAG: 4-hydroxy-tetrahydrodipicolinate reductase, partial [Streptosporangiales bacterium]
MIKVGVMGAMGRMGTQICAAVSGEQDMTLAAGVDVGDDREALAGCD